MVLIPKTFGSIYDQQIPSAVLLTVRNELDIHILNNLPTLVKHLSKIGKAGDKEPAEKAKEGSNGELSNLQSVQSIFKLNFFCQEISSNSSFVLVAEFAIHIPESKRITK